MVVTLGAALLGRYPRFTLHNSPYVAHDAGRAVDLYPAAGAPSPVAGEVLDVRTVAAPPKPYAAADDHLVLVAVDEAASPVSWDGAEADADGAGDRSSAGSDDPTAITNDTTTTDDPLVARILHVDPAVEPGDEVSVGDPLGRPIRSGFFAPWVAPHLHVGFRGPDADPYRASGSLPLAADVAVAPLPWDGSGTVVERGDTYAVLDAPAHPDPGDRFVGVAARVGEADDGVAADEDASDGGVGDAGSVAGDADSGSTVALDGGLPHYDGGGLLGGVRDSDEDAPTNSGPVSLLGERVGVATDGRVAWDDVTVLLDGAPVTGLSLFAAQDGRFGAKVVCPDHPPALGERVTVSVRGPSADPGRRT